MNEKKINQILKNQQIIFGIMLKFDNKFLCLQKEDLDMIERCNNRTSYFVDANQETSFVEKTKDALSEDKE